MPRRSPSCDGTYCEPRLTGWWHSEDCMAASDTAAPVEDMAVATAREDGYARPLLATVPQQRDRGEAA